MRQTSSPEIKRQPSLPDIQRQPSSPVIARQASTPGVPSNATPSNTAAGATASGDRSSSRMRAATRSGEFGPKSKRGSVVDGMELPVPSPEGFMSTAAKMSLADIALALREEQVEAKVVKYKEELPTSPELDAVTEALVREFTQIQKHKKSSGHSVAPAYDRTQLEIELIQSLKEMLARIFRPGKLATFCERKLAEVSKRFARRFFESELHDKLREGDGEVLKTMRFASQALFHVLSRHEDSVTQALEAFDYDNDEVFERAKAQYGAFLKEMRNDFLSRTTPELNELVRVLNDVLTRFFTEELPQDVGELAWEVVKEAKLAELEHAQQGYKLSRDLFGRFRQAFDRRFLQRLVPFAEEEMLKRVRAAKTPFREDTIRFVADPFIFSETCEIICDSIYDMLYNDGFLDLPADWRVRLQKV
jgi:hypothetical protein